MERPAARKSPYTELSFGWIREIHDQVYFGPWRGPSPTDDDLLQAHRQLSEFPVLEFQDHRRPPATDMADEVQRARSLEARRYLTKARAAYRKADPEAEGGDALRNLDTALSYAHSALNALLLHSRAPAHDPRDFESFYDVVGVPFQDLV